MIDLSIKGARLELVEPFNPGESLFLVIHFEKIEITVPAIVLWCELESMLVDLIHDRYIAGVAFDRVSGAVQELINDLTAREAAIRIEDFRNYDRYRLISPLSGSFGDLAPISIADLSIRGARIMTAAQLGIGVSDHLRFHVDDEAGTIDVVGRVMWSAPSNVPGMVNHGLHIVGQDEVLRGAIERLCLRGDARIDLHSLRRKFDTMRALARRRQGETGADETSAVSEDATS